MQDRSYKAVAVLTSGGVESASLLAEATRRCERVYPLYIREGLLWESVELAYLRRKLLPSFKAEGLAPLSILDVPIRSIYRDHWSFNRKKVPGAQAPDLQVYLPGRNLIFLSLAGLFCSLRRIPVLWLGVLKGNPFKDSKIVFLRQMEQLIQDGLGWPLRIAAPLRELSKAQVIRRWQSLPWEKTFSCIKPVNHRHCGRCNKCAERKKGFKQAGIMDPTEYSK